jgi:hypothetical protein
MSVIVAGARARRLVYARPATMAPCTAAITSPAPAPSIVKPRIRSLCASMSAFMNPRVSPMARARRTELMGRRAPRIAIPRRFASASPSPTRPSYMNRRSVPSRPRRRVAPIAPTPRRCTCRPRRRPRRHSGSARGCSSGLQSMFESPSGTDSNSNPAPPPSGGPAWAPLPYRGTCRPPSGNACAILLLFTRACADALHGARAPVKNGCGNRNGWGHGFARS